MNPPAYQVTEWGHPEEKMNTCVGVITYKRWLQLEMQRWDAKDLDKRNNWLQSNSEGLIAMFTDWPGVKVVTNELL